MAKDLPAVPGIVEENLNVMGRIDGTDDGPVFVLTDVTQDDAWLKISLRHASNLSENE